MQEKQFLLQSLKHTLLLLVLKYLNSLPSYLALSTISLISLSTSSASFLLTSGKNWEIIVGFIPTIFTFSFSSKTLILQGIQREINLFLFKKLLACFAEQISIIFIGLCSNPFAASLSFTS